MTKIGLLSKSNLKQLTFSFSQRLLMTDQQKNQKSNPSLSEASDRETQDAPLSQYPLKSTEFSRSPIQTIQVQKQKCKILVYGNSQQKRQPRFHKQTKILFYIFCFIVFLLIVINIFIFGDQQVNNKTALFTSVNEEKTQQAHNLDKLPEESGESPYNKDLLKKQYQPSFPIVANTISYDGQEAEIKNEPSQTTPNMLINDDRLAKIKSLESDTKDFKEKPQIKTFQVKTPPPFKIKKIINRPPSHTVKYKLISATPPPPVKKPKKVKSNRKTPRAQQVNILSHIAKNPYGQQKFAGISKSDIRRANRWRVLASQFYDANCPIAEQELEYYMKKYSIEKYQELPFCIVIPTINNKANRRAEKNIKSVLMQNYTNYRVIIIDDGSTDGTAQFIQRFLKNQTVIDKKRYKVQKNRQRRYALPNVLYAANTFCKPDDIFMVIDGDDELLGKQVLKLFNAVFQKQKIWFMYTNFITSVGTLGYSRPYPPEIIKKNAYRDYGFTVTHLRAYYTKLLLNIKDEDLRDQTNKYFTAAGDMAIVMPCLEQAHERARYVAELTYVYNWNTGQNVHNGRLNLQRGNNLKIRAKHKYQPLQTLF